MSSYNIMAVLVNHRSRNAVRLQDVLTRYGCMIKMRLGLHETGDACSEEGLVVLQLSGGEEEIDSLLEELNGLDGVTAKNIRIDSKDTG